MIISRAVVGLHYILAQRPSKQRRDYLDVWRQFCLAFLREGEMELRGRFLRFGKETFQAIGLSGNCWPRRGVECRNLVIVLALLSASFSPFGSVPGQAQTPLRPLNTVPTAREEIGRVPNHLVWLRANLQAVQDPVDGELVFLNDAGGVVGRVALPAGFRVSHVVPEVEQVRLVGETGRQIVVPRTVDPTQTTSLESSEITGPRAAGGASLIRRGSKRLLLSDGRRAGAARIDLRSLAGGTLADAYDIGTDASGNRYVVTEEIVAATPNLQVRVFVRRFDRSGRGTGAAAVSLDQMDVVPRGFATVTDAGVVRILVPTQTGVTMRELSFAPGARSPRGARGALAPAREIALQSNVVPVEGAGDFVAPAQPRARPPATPPISRAQMLANGAAYLTVNWVMKESSFAKADVENVCDREQWKHWTRPRHFTKEMIGTTIGPMPYHWGGDDTPASYKRRIEQGALAGSVCTCRDAKYNQCVVREAAGVDCSGFVSRSWGIPKLGTSGLFNVATRINRIDDVRPGDAFNWGGRHVRLVVGRQPGPAITFRVLESATRSDCEGVCERPYRASEMNKYSPIRYRGVTD